MKYESFMHYWEVNSKDMPTDTDEQMRIKLIAYVWGMEVWKAAKGEIEVPEECNAK